MVPFYISQYVFVFEGPFYHCYVQERSIRWRQWSWFMTIVSRLYWQISDDSGPPLHSPILHKPICFRRSILPLQCTEKGPSDEDEDQCMCCCVVVPHEEHCQMVVLVAFRSATTSQSLPVHWYNFTVSVNVPSTQYGQDWTIGTPVFHIEIPFLTQSTISFERKPKLLFL